MSRKTIDTLWDRKTRNDINDNFEELYSGISGYIKDIPPENTTFFKSSDKNLFNGVYENGFSYFTASGEYGYIAYSTSPHRYLMYVEIEKGETYTVTKLMGGNRFNVMFTNEKPEKGKRAYLIDEPYQGGFDSTQKSYTFTNENARFLVVQTNIGVPNPPLLQVEKGEEYTGYEQGTYIPRQYLDLDDGQKNHKFNFPINLNTLYRKENEIDDYVDNPGNLTVEEYHKMFDDLISEYPEIVKKSKLGDVTGDFPLYKYEIIPPEYWVEYTNDSGGDGGRPIRPPKVVMTTGIHGHERSPSISAYYYFKEILENPEENDLVDFLKMNVHFICIPLANPSGWTEGTYANGNGYNLNRQFPPFRDKPAESEAILVKNVIDDNADMDFFIDFHNMYFRDGYLSYTLSNTELFKYPMNNIYRNLGRSWANQYPEMPQEINHVWGYNSQSNNGTVGNYVETQLSIPGMLMEVIRENKWINDGNFGESVARLGVELIVNAQISALRSKM